MRTFSGLPPIFPFSLSALGVEWVSFWAVKRVPCFIPCSCDVIEEAICGSLQ